MKSSAKTKPDRKKRPVARRGKKLFRYDRSLAVRFVAGADEAGRGSLAGPIVGAAVLFDLSKIGRGEVRLLSLLDDSKSHTLAGREKLFPTIMRLATKVCIVVRTCGTIDRDGLHRTNLAVLRCALRKVTEHLEAGKDDYICLSDGFSVDGSSPHHRRVIAGDQTSAAIAAASVIAKVTRDRFMQVADELHNGWGFKTNAGYGTPEHRQAILDLGVSPLHRMSFDSVAYQQLGLLSEDVLENIDLHDHALALPPPPALQE